MVLVLIMEVFFTGILLSFGNDNKRRICYIIWLGYRKVLVTGILFTFAFIIVTIVDVVVAGVI